MKKINDLTGIRAFAAIWVVLYHFSTSTIIKELPWGGISKHGFLGVDIFFVLSGFILSITYADKFRDGIERIEFAKFVVKRFARIYPLHFVTLLGMVALVFSARILNVKMSDTNTAFDLISAIHNFLLTHAWGFLNTLSWNFPSWSISVEWFAYIIIFPLMFWLFKNSDWRLIGVTVLVLWLGYFTYMYTSGRQHLDANSNGVIRIAPEFLAGFLLYKIIPKINKINGDILSLIGLISLLAITLSRMEFEFFVLPSVMLIIYGAFCGGKITSAILGNRMAVYLGEISYSIYMTHLFVQILGNQITRRFHVEFSFWTAVFILLLDLSIVIIIGALAYKWIEVPGRRMVNEMAGKVRDFSFKSVG